MDLNNITEQIIGAAIAIHRELGSSLNQPTRHASHAYELIEQGLRIEQQKAVPVRYRGVCIEGWHTPENCMTFLPSVSSVPLW